MWRKKNEAFQPKLSGDDPWAKQVPLNRAVPFWGGCSAGGFACIVFHGQKKVTTEEWIAVVEKGQLTKAIRQLKPVKKNGPWQVLCDNETFLDASSSAHAKVGVKLWHVPAKSPDLNPVEKVWSSLRRHLRKMDLADAVAQKPHLSKTAYVARVKRVLKTKNMQHIAAKCAGGLRKVCREVIAKRGAATSG